MWVSGFSLLISISISNVDIDTNYIYMYICIHIQKRKQKHANMFFLDINRYFVVRPFELGVIMPDGGSQLGTFFCGKNQATPRLQDVAGEK